MGHGRPESVGDFSCAHCADGAWAIPEAPKQMPPDAKPVFDVVTVKPSPPGRGGKNIGFDGHHFLLRNANLNDMIALASDCTQNKSRAHPTGGQRPF